MRNPFGKIKHIFFSLGYLLITLGLITFVPLFMVFYFWKANALGVSTAMVELKAFGIPAFISIIAGLIIIKNTKPGTADLASSMISCTLGWILAGLIGALPFYITGHLNMIDALFEAVSGFTTTGITMVQHLQKLPKSLLFWRCLTQWFGGLGIISFFMITRFGASGGTHQILSAESHKVASTRPVPGLFNTLKIIWGIYIFFTIFIFILFSFAQMPLFEGLCHSLTTISTGGFSVWDDNIDHYRAVGSPFFKHYEYIIILGMVLGSINFFIHYKLFTGKISALWSGSEIRLLWFFFAIFTIMLIIDRSLLHGQCLEWSYASVESLFRTCLFQCTSMLSTAGFTTTPICSDWYAGLSKFLFLAMIFTGGCAGSTSGGFKIFRIMVFNKMVWQELFRLKFSKQAISKIILDKKIIDSRELHTLSALLFAWFFLIFLGTAVTCSSTGAHITPFKALSGMFTCLSNTGPSFMENTTVMALPISVKLIYILTMLAGRLEIFPFLLIFYPRAWR